MENKSLAKQKPPRYEITNQYQMAKMASVLREHIVKNNLSVKIIGKDYAMVEGWQFAGGLTGLFPVIIDTIELSKGNEIKWKSICHIIRIKDDKQVARGDALCSNKESKKASFDEYAILSMAQTRSIGKAYRNLLGWVMKLAGYEATPAEEIKSEQPRTGTKLSVMDINKKIDQINNKDLLGKMTAWIEKHTTDYTETQMNVMRRRLEELAKSIK
jgi:hypothetical protein